MVPIDFSLIYRERDELIRRYQYWVRSNLFNEISENIYIEFASNSSIARRFLLFTLIIAQSSNRPRFISLLLAEEENLKLNFDLILDFQNGY